MSRFQVRSVFVQLIQIHILSIDSLHQHGRGSDSAHRDWIPLKENISFKKREASDCKRRSHVVN